MKKEYLQKHVGNMQQLAFARKLTYEEGRSSGLKAIEVKNGCLRFCALQDKALDIGEIEYKGTQLSFLSKPGLIGRNHYDTHGDEALRSIMGGLFFTCGLENICAPHVSHGKEYPMHGRMRTTPAEHVSSDAYWDGDDYILSVSGEMREAELFGENLVLRRKITTKLGKTSLTVSDCVTNEAFRSEPFMLMYHCNIGYPFLSEASRLILPSKKITPRDDISKANLDSWNSMSPPKDNEGEYVYIHELASDNNGDTFAAVVNPATQIALKISFNVMHLPYFMQWKSVASGDYVIGLEPSNSLVYGRAYHENNNSLHMLKPQQSENTELSFEILEGESAIKRLEDQCHQLLKK